MLASFFCIDFFSVDGLDSCSVVSFELQCAFTHTRALLQETVHKKQYYVVFDRLFRHISRFTFYVFLLLCLTEAVHTRCLGIVSNWMCLCLRCTLARAFISHIRCSAFQRCASPLRYNTQNTHTQTSSEWFNKFRSWLVCHSLYFTSTSSLLAWLMLSFLCGISIHSFITW